MQGTAFYAVEDTDSTVFAPTDVVQLDWTGIDISGETGLELSLFLAEDDDPGREDWDADSSVVVEVRIDSGFYFKVFAIESASGAVGNREPRIDTDFDGIGDGTEITDVFTQFSIPIPTGSTLDIRLTISNLDSNDEDIAIDNVMLTSVEMVPPTVTVDIVDGSLHDNDAVSVVTFEFSEDVVGFAADDVSVTNGTLSGFTTVDGNSFTAMFTASGGIDATGSVSVGTGYTDAAGNAGTAGSDTVAIDTLNPTVTVNIVDASLSDNDAVSLVTFEFSENVVGFTADDVSLTNGTLSGFTTVDGNSFTAMFTANGGIDATGSVSVGTGYTDAAGNAGTAGSDTVAIDTLNPTVTVNIVDASLSDKDAISLVTFEFSENVVGFTAADVSVTNGTLSGFTAVDGNSFTAMFTANGGIDATGSVSVGTGYTDAAGNSGTSGSDTVAIDTLNPTVVVNIVDASLSDNDAVSLVTFEFSENVAGFTVDDVSVTNGTLSGFTSVDGNSFTAMFTANGGIDATGSVSVGTGYTDAVGNAGTAGSDTVTIDTLNPSVTVNIVDASLSDNDAVSLVTFEFSENVVGFTAGDVSVTNGTLSGFTTVDGNSFTAMFTANGGIDATGSVSVGTGYTDAVGNAGTAGSDTVDIDTLNPTVTVNIVDASLSDNDAVSLVTFEFSENVTGFTAADVSVTNGTLSGFTPVDGNSFTAMFTANGGIDAIGSVTVVAAAYRDAADNAGATGSDTVAIDTLNPTVTVNIVDASLSDNDAVSLVTFEFSENLVGFTADDVSVANGTLSGFTAVDGNSFTAMFTANGGIDATGSVSVGSGYTDAVGNAGAAGSDTVDIDTLNPTVTVNIVDASLSDNDAVSVVTFEFSENVVGFTAADVSLTNGTLSGFTAVDGNSFTAMFTANGSIDATGSVSVGTGYTDAVGNAGTAGSDTVASIR